MEDAKNLRAAFKGLGCDKDKVIRILGARSNGQRQLRALQPSIFLIRN